MVLEGKVRINGKVVDRLGFKVDPFKDHIRVDGRRITGTERKITLALNKPRGYLSTVKDPLGRPTVIDLVERVKERIYPVGRLDFDSEGLLLLTNDGEIANILTHPRFSIPRTYLTKVTGVPDEKKLTLLKKGVMLEDGKARVESCDVIRQGEKNSWVRVRVTEGRNRLVRRIFSAIGHSVLKLKRVEYGPIGLGKLPVGHFRVLTAEEIEKLKEIRVLSKEFGHRRQGTIKPN